MFEMARTSRTLSVAVLVMALACFLGTCCPSAVADAILAANYGLGDRIESFGLGGAYNAPFITGLTSAPISVVQGGDGNIYVGSATGVSQFGPDGTLMDASLIVLTEDMATDLTWHDSKLWVATWNGVTFAFNPATYEIGVQKDWSGAATNPYGLKFGPDGRCYVSFYGTGDIWAWDTVTDEIEGITSPGGNLAGMAWDGDALYVNRSDTGQIYKWTQAGGLVPWVVAPAGTIGMAIRDGKLYCAAGTVLNTYSLADGSLLYFGYLGGGMQQLCVRQVETVATPTFSPDGGVYGSTQTVTISCATSGASIYYTTDGTDPSEATVLYTGPVTVDHNMRLRAKAYKAGSEPSAIKSAGYVIGEQSKVALVAGYGAGKIEKFSLDGSYIGTFLSVASPIAILQGEDTNLYVGTAIGVAKYGRDGTVINANFIPIGDMVTDMTWEGGLLWITTWGGLTSAYNPTTGTQVGPAITWPTDAGASTNPYGLEFGPDGRCYVCFWTTGDVWAWDTSTGTTELIVPAIGDNVGSLDWNGSDLYISSNLGTIYKWNSVDGLLTWTVEPAGCVGVTAFNGMLYSAQRATLHAWSIAETTEINSSASSSDYLQQICIADVSTNVATPTFSPDGGLYDSTQSVTITCATAGATIRYTTDGSDPTESSAIYASPVTVDHDLVLKAKAYKSGDVPSEIKGGRYNIGPRSQLLLVACYDTGKVEKFTLDGVYAGTFANRSGVVGVLQGGDGNVYAGGLNGVAKYAADGTLIKSNFITGPSFVTDLAWHDNKLWLTDWSGLTAAYDPATGAQSGPTINWAGTASNPYGLKFGPDGRCYVCFWSTGDVWAWDTTTNETASIVTPGGNLGSLVWNGSDLYISANSTPVVYKWTEAGGLVEWANGPRSGLGITINSDKLYRAASSASGGAFNDISIYSLADASLVSNGAGAGYQMQQICILTLSVDPTPITQIKGAADGTAVACGSVAVTAVFGNSFYVEDAGRASGIQVRTSGSTPAVNDLLNVTGVIRTDATTGERYIDSSLIQSAGTYTVGPIGVTNKNLGGGPAGLQAGIDGASGLNNIGMLVKTTGKVVTPGTDVFYLDDGSSVTVKVTDGTVYAENAYVTVTGISSCEIVDGKLSRVIRALNVTKLQDP